jgi:hypothetical protein
MQRLTKLFFGAILLLTISGCDKKSCTKVVCASYQGCYQGQCVCLNGYEGVDCATVSATKYTGNWIVSENCGNGVTSPNPGGYSVYISPVGSPVSYISISNLLNLGTSFNAELYNTTPGAEGTQIHIFAASQGGVAISDSYGYYTTQNGSIQMIIILNYSYNSFNYSCQETFTKQ